MRSVQMLSLALVAGGAVLFATAPGCGGDSGTGNGNDGGLGGDGFPIFGQDTGGGGGPCQKLQCQQVDCAAQGKPTTTVSGTVYAPTPVNPDPLYNAIVYVPNAPVDPFPAGVTCDKCGALTTGSPVVTALSGPDGKFVLQNVPVGDNIPIVVQIGKWRRQQVIPHVSACTDTPVPAALTRLPRNKTEGDIPLHAVSSGNADGLECVLRKMGVDDAEFTVGGGSGRIHLFEDNGATMQGILPATSLYGDVNTLKKYDLVVFDCVGGQVDKPQTALTNVIDYTSAGGRVFASHYSYVWLYNINPFSGTAQWNVDQNFPTEPFFGILDTSFPKGQAFATWLGNVGALAGPNKIQIHQPRHDAEAAIPPNGQRWISSTAPNPNTLQHYTFNTPVGVPDDQQCGRVVFSDFHVSAANTSGGRRFPTECDNKPLSPQEKVLEFMLFDLASCVQKDGTAPKPPPIVK